MVNLRALQLSTKRLTTERFTTKRFTTNRFRLKAAFVVLLMLVVASSWLSVGVDSVLAQSGNGGAVETIERSTQSPVALTNERRLAVAAWRQGRQVVVNEAVGGPLFILGGEVQINAPVQGDVFIMGADVQINAPIAQDLYVVGGQVNINNAVVGQVLVVGGRVMVGAAARVSQDLWVAAEKFILNGWVSGQVRFISGEADVSAATVQGDLVGRLAAPTSDDSGQLAALNLHMASVSGQTDVQFMSPLGRQQQPVPPLVWRRVWWASGQFLWGLLVWYLFHPLWRRGGQQLTVQWWSVLTTGMAVLAGWLLVLPFLLLSVIGIPMAIMGSLALLGLLSVSWIIPAWWLGHRLLTVHHERWQIVFGLMLVVSLQAVPILGWFWRGGVASAGVGAALTMIWSVATKQGSQKTKHLL